MELSLKGIVLKSTEYGKNSRVLTLLTAEKGKISVIAKGCVSLKSPIHACSCLFAYSNLRVIQNSNKYFLESGEVNELFTGLSKDISKLSLAQYFADVCTYIAQEGIEEQDLLRLLLNSLYVLCDSNDNDFVKAVFETKLIDIMGLSPDLSACNLCENEGGGYLLLYNGSFLCEKCFDNVSKAVFINEYAINAIKLIFESPINKIFSFKLSGESRLQLLNFAEKYLIAQADLNLKSLNFYKSFGSDIK